MSEVSGDTLSGSGLSSPIEPVPVSPPDGASIPIACKPFSVHGEMVTARQIANAIDRLANLPPRFRAMSLMGCFNHLGGHGAQEATNRLLQRWRKMGLTEFGGGKWMLTREAWDKLQASATEARRAETAKTGSVHDGAVPERQTPNLKP